MMFMNNCVKTAALLSLIFLWASLMTLVIPEEIDSSPRNLVSVKSKCPKNHFIIGNMAECRPLLTCSDLLSVEFVKLIGYGAVKWVFLGRWNTSLVALSVLKNDLYFDDFHAGLDVLKSLGANPHVVQLVGYCKRRNTIATEYHQLNNANSLKYVFSAKTLPFDLPMKLCENYVEMLRFLHESPIGMRVNCDSDSVEKILSQIVVTNRLELVLCDVDALPEFNSSVSITCGKNVPLKRASLIPPELIDSHNPGYRSGYSDKSDIWKVPNVCNYFFSLANVDAISFAVFDISKKCKNYDPSKRPSSGELVQMYRDRFKSLQLDSSRKVHALYT